MIMPIAKNGFAIALMVLGCASSGHAQDKDKHLPSDEDINLVVGQANRAMEQYKLAINQEEIFMGKAGAEAEAISQDRHVLENWDFATKALHAKPQIFNTPAGFSVVLTLDDAARNGMVCATQAVSNSALRAMALETGKADSLVHLSQTCMDASTLLYTVSESVAALYQKYLDAEQQLAEESFDVASKCTAMLKKNATTPK